MSTTTWTANQIRNKFLDFFKSKQHEIVTSAPLVLKNDSTLLFTNAGMNQFKDFFLNYKEPSNTRIADTQKCLRVSGKHNDLEDVGLDTYHHTMFEMLGNWSFGDYFKKEAIAWAWELLTKEFGIAEDQIYVTVFEGDEQDGLGKDTEAFNFWKDWIAEDKILNGNKADNFWEMGETGPCGPCSEIHVDIRSKEERETVDGKTLVNQDHPQVVEIWNLVFMQYNRLANGNLERLPKQHIDTGMGFERLCMILQNKQSNYDTDLFEPLISKLEQISKKTYQQSQSKSDVAFRVVSDHIRAVAFAIADGQLPSNTGAGYVIRRILRRAVRYGYSFLNQENAFLYKLISPLSQQMGTAFPEVKKQEEFIAKVVREEEQSFLRTLSKGLAKLDTLHQDLSGEEAFELYDTYGFPLDLTLLIASEKGLSVDEVGFETAMKQQKARSRTDAKTTTGDWTVLAEGTGKFVGYDESQTNTEILRYRTVQQKGKDIHQLVLAKTPFYAESGGQVGDKGVISVGENKVRVFDTKKENELIIHFTKDSIDELNNEPQISAQVNRDLRNQTKNNHTATHLLHAALRIVLGNHVEQKGSLVAPDKLRFDFSHFGKMTAEELTEVEEMVNGKISEAIEKKEQRKISFDQAIEQGAMALFGEKYGDTVRVITFDPTFSVELCGGCHVENTAQIRLFKLVSEGAISAGVRRIEAITGEAAISHYKMQEQTVKELSALLNQSPNPIKSVEQLLEQNNKLQATVAEYTKNKAGNVKEELKNSIQKMGDINFIGEVVNLGDADALKNLSFSLKQEVDNLFLILGAEVNGKANLSIMISENLVSEKNLNAAIMIRELAKPIQGGGGGQPFYATAGGKKVDELSTAIAMARSLLDAMN